VAPENCTPLQLDEVPWVAAVATSGVVGKAHEQKCLWSIWDIIQNSKQHMHKQINTLSNRSKGYESKFKCLQWMQKKGRKHDLVIFFAEETDNKDAKRKTFTMTNPNF